MQLGSAEKTADISSRFHEYVARLDELENIILGVFECKPKDYAFYFWRAHIRTHVEALKREGRNLFSFARYFYARYFFPYEQTLADCIELWRRFADRKMFVTSEELVHLECRLVCTFRLLMNAPNAGSRGPRRSAQFDPFDELWPAQQWIRVAGEDNLPAPLPTENNTTRAVDVLFWPRFCGERQSVPMSEFAEALYLHITIVEKQRVLCGRDAFKAMVKNQMGVTADTSEVHTKSCANLFFRVGPTLRYIYHRMAGLALANARGDVAPWAELSWSNLQCEEALRGILPLFPYQPMPDHSDQEDNAEPINITPISPFMTTTPTATTTTTTSSSSSSSSSCSSSSDSTDPDAPSNKPLMRFIIRVERLRRAFVLHYIRKDEKGIPAVVAPTRILLTSQGYCLDGGEQHHRTIRELLDAEVCQRLDYTDEREVLNNEAADWENLRENYKPEAVNLLDLLRIYFRFPKDEAEVMHEHFRDKLKTKENNTTWNEILKFLDVDSSCKYDSEEVLTGIYLLLHPCVEKYFPGRADAMLRSWLPPPLVEDIDESQFEALLTETVVRFFVEVLKMEESDALPSPGKARLKRTLSKNLESCDGFTNHIFEQFAHVKDKYHARSEQEETEANRGLEEYRAHYFQHLFNFPNLIVNELCESYPPGQAIKTLLLCVGWFAYLLPPLVAILLLISVGVRSVFQMEGKLPVRFVVDILRPFAFMMWLVFVYAVAKLNPELGKTSPAAEWEHARLRVRESDIQAQSFRPNNEMQFSGLAFFDHRFFAQTPCAVRLTYKSTVPNIVQVVQKDFEVAFSSARLPSLRQLSRFQTAANIRKEFDFIHPRNYHVIWGKEDLIIDVAPLQTETAENVYDRLKNATGGSCDEYQVDVALISARQCTVPLSDKNPTKQSFVEQMYSGATWDKLLCTGLHVFLPSVFSFVTPSPLHNSRLMGFAHIVYQLPYSVGWCVLLILLSRAADNYRKLTELLKALNELTDPSKARTKFTHYLPLKNTSNFHYWILLREYAQYEEPTHEREVAIFSAAILDAFLVVAIWLQVKWECDFSLMHLCLMVDAAIVMGYLGVLLWCAKQLNDTLSASRDCLEISKRDVAFSSHRVSELLAQATNEAGRHLGAADAEDRIKTYTRMGAELDAMYKMLDAGSDYISQSDKPVEFLGYSADVATMSGVATALFSLATWIVAAYTDDPPLDNARKLITLCKGFTSIDQCILNINLP